jgi:hypothetical protein
MHFRQVFWSILGNITNYTSGLGLSDFIVSRVIVRDIPVANGKTKASLIEGYPNILFAAFMKICLVSLTISEDPIAFG